MAGGAMVMAFCPSQTYDRLHCLQALLHSAMGLSRRACRQSNLSQVCDGQNASTIVPPARKTKARVSPSP
jgi:hypothetical protein